MSNNMLRIMRPIAILCGGAGIGIATGTIIKPPVFSLLTAIFLGVAYLITMIVIFDIAERIH